MDKTDKRRQVMVTLNIDKKYSCDVLVCGGGVSGFAAAVSAATSGASVILIESGGFLGGTATKGLVGPFMTCMDADGKNQIIRGIFDKLTTRMVQKGGAISPHDCPAGISYSGYRIAGHKGVTPFNHEVLKQTLEEMCIEAGVKLLYHTIVIGCDTQNDSIKTVYAASENQIMSFDAKAFIDTTGGCALALKAGAKTTRGDKEGILQTASMFFIISGVDKEMLDEYMQEHTEMRKRFYMDVFDNGRECGAFPCGTQKLRIYEQPNGNWIVNMAQIDDQFDEKDAETVSNEHIDQRKQILKIFEFLKTNIPALKNIKLISTASNIGYRESTRLVGKSTLTLDDMQNATYFDDRIAVCANSIDIHQKVGVSYSAHISKSYYIPLSCLISENITNLFTAGKSLSADKYAFAAVRVMPPCMAMGEAVGIASAMLAKTGTVDSKEVQTELVKRGAYIG